MDKKIICNCYKCNYGENLWGRYLKCNHPDWPVGESNPVHTDLASEWGEIHTPIDCPLKGKEN